MIEIGGKPILWHIMKIYSSYGIDDFIVCLGYRGYMIKEYFANYFLHMSDVTFDMGANRMQVHQASAEPWKVPLVDTGEATLTGGRLKRVAGYLGDEDFCFTYGDGVSDVDIDALVRFHRRQGRVVTLTAVRPPARYGGLCFAGDDVVGFSEKPQTGEGWINGGFMVCEPAVFDYLEADDTSLEYHVLERLAADGQLAAYRHPGFWQCMDTLRDKQLLEKIWQSGRAPWITSHKVSATQHREAA